MFENLHIENFQSHEDSILEFAPGINIIVPEKENDPNDIGKTSIIRAFQLLTTNRPSGGNYFPNSKDSGKTIISAKLSDGKTISLTKTIKDKEVKKSIYEFGEFKAKTGVAVPDQVVSALNLSEMNIQQQLDEPYLVTSSGANVAKTINRITKIEQSDEWISSLTTEINTTNRDVIKLKQDIKIKEVELKKYFDIDDTISLANRLEKIEKKIKNYTNDYDYLYEANTKLSKIGIWISGHRKDTFDLGRFINGIEKIFVEEGSTSKEKEVLWYLLTLIEEIEKLKHINIDKDLNTIQDIIKEKDYLIKEKKYLQGFIEVSNIVVDLKKVNIDKDLNTIQDIIKEKDYLIKEKKYLQGFIEVSNIVVNSKKVNIEKDLNTIQDILQKINNAQREEYNLLKIVDSQKNISVLNDNFSKIKEEYVLSLKKFGKCPTCLSIIEDETVKKITKEL